MAVFFCLLKLINPGPISQDNRDTGIVMAVSRNRNRS